MKGFIKTAIILLVFLVIYFLFQPILVHNFGWKSYGNKHENINYKNNIDSLFFNEYKKLKTPALSISVRKNETILYNKTLGFADIDKNIKATNTTKFRIGSVSKALTSGGLGILLDKKRLELNTKVEDLFPKKFQKLSNLTVQELASHTSGIRNYGTCLCFPIWEYYNNNQYNSVEQAIHIFSNDDLLFRPSSSFSYSSYNYTMLSLLMEKSANTKFTSFMNSKVFKPLNMDDTSSKEIGNIATFYAIEKEEYKTVFKVNNSNKIAGGGFVSTANDLSKYASSILSNKLFSEKTKQLLFTPVKLSNGKVNVQNYGLGWRIDDTTKIFNDKRKVKIIHHGGVATGATAFLILLPEYNISAAITMNSNTSEGASKLSRILYKIINELIHDDKVHYVKL